ncbi:hypothetical protein E2C01_076492 [Portunus trituberculatus]|uniref:Uncharacterized protein n=1 Tax=Portunus trituberculatus TaxID=210409 RepID=A0A5B7INP9_PORTR|nr:hypothetical protein [Portunus trituberculatus]
MGVPPSDRQGWMGPGQHHATHASRYSLLALLPLPHHSLPLLHFPPLLPVVPSLLYLLLLHEWLLALGLRSYNC